MKKITWKHLAACLAAVVLVASVAACNPSEPNEESSTDEVEVTTELTDGTVGGDDETTPTENENESTPGAGQEDDSKKEETSKDILGGFDRDENGNIVLPDLPISSH